MAKKRRKKKSIEQLKVKEKRKKINGSVGGDVCIFIFLSLLGVFMVFPLYYSVIQSLKPVEELFVFPPKLYVLRPTTKNFSDMVKVAAEYIVPLSRYVFNSVFTTIIICVTNVFVTCMAAFVLSKCKFPGDKLLNKIIVIALLFQSQATWIMSFLVYSKLNMIDSYAVLILPYIATAMNLYLMRQSMSTIHDAMVEAAKVDGAGLFRICWQIVVPNQKPAIMTIIIFAFQQAWNINGGAVIYSEEYKTLPTIVQQISLAGLARQGVTFASAVLLLIPPLVVFLVAQGNVMETMANSGMKD
ncbi:ABC-type glycerol-3-phosphate transport system, permease component [Ruminococcus sp. YE71]|uniref:carbohydrate ABC transporter permease n=1 Tax=unclassified Ruminococcus TaxID=2608920 RepID=UPI0008839CC3|nr:MULTISPECIES: carbohydrate ABC transporter permease [unclassified Ruminococcus]SDA14713.1 ABC-type glycerol-3-phosphate transport system, permease component [Ruminococcus sp. YE78]SFW21372.1 ABC-type glycerol-3-phosphate transport system, permease component [Ruminococcus sp. YE71]